MKTIVAIDQGTTGTRCILFDRRGQIVAAEYEEHEQIYPQPGWVEHDALEIWDNTRRVVSAALAHANRRYSEHPAGMRWSAWGSPTSARRSWSGTGAPASRCTMPSSGSACARSPFASA